MNSGNYTMGHGNRKFVAMACFLLLAITGCISNNEYKDVFFTNKHISFTASLNSNWNYKLDKMGNFTVLSQKTQWFFNMYYRQTEDEAVKLLNLCLKKNINQFLKECKNLNISIRHIQLKGWTGKLCVIENSSQCYFLHKDKYCLFLSMEHPALSTKTKDVIHFIDTIDNITPYITTLNNINVIMFDKFNLLWKFKLNSNYRFEFNNDFIYLWINENNKIYIRIIPAREKQHQSYIRNILRELRKEFHEEYVFLEKKHVGIWELLIYTTDNRKKECWFALHNNFCICIIVPQEAGKSKKILTEFIKSLKYTQ